MYAIIKTGGKQIKVTAGYPIFIEKLDVETTSKVAFDEVLAVFDGKELHVGQPLLKAEVKGTVQKQGKHKKVIIFKTKEKSNWQTKNGHRQLYTRVLIEELILDGKSLIKAEEVKPVRFVKKVEAPIVEEVTPETVVTEEVKPEVAAPVVEEVKTEAPTPVTDEVKSETPVVEETKTEEA